MSKSMFVGALKHEAVSKLSSAQNGRCAYCGERKRHRFLTLDHVMPLGVGGVDEFENLLAVCLPCNQGKGCDLPTLEFHEVIRRRVHSGIREREARAA